MSALPSTEQTSLVRDAGRASIDTYPGISKFRPGDIVYIDVANSRGLEGPYLIETVLPRPGPTKYTLCNESGERAKEGQEFSEKELRLHKWGIQVRDPVS